ncbi:hypothetical protein ACF0H5_004233 [Mactra antiquata]
MMVGVAKCGTTELLDFMSIHPNIVSKRKPDQLPSSEFVNASGHSRIKEEMPCKYYDQISVLKSDSFLGEKRKPLQIYKMKPNMKIMAIIREPVARLISDLTFNMPSRQSTRTHIDNSMVMKLFIQNLLNKTEQETTNFQVQQSKYDEGIRRYLEVFNQDQILIIESNEFVKNPVRVVKRIEHFLGIKSFVSDKYFVLHPEKPFYCIRKMDEEKTVACYGKNRGRKDVKVLVDDADRKALKNYYRPHSENLFRILGKRYDWLDS